MCNHKECEEISYTLRTPRQVDLSCGTYSSKICFIEAYKELVDIKYRAAESKEFLEGLPKNCWAMFPDQIKDLMNYVVPEVSE